MSIIVADARQIPLPDESVHCVVTSPPYYGLRNYQVDKQIGLERSPEEYVATLVAVFREVWRVLRSDGVCFLNLGDSYAGSGGAHKEGHANPGLSQSWKRNGVPHWGDLGQPSNYLAPNGLKPKDLIGIPWRVALALQADGWWLRSDIIWHKPNPMPESVRDRPTRSHEYVFLLTKAERYYYDADAIKEPVRESSLVRLGQDVDSQPGSSKPRNGMAKPVFGGVKAAGYGTRIASGNEWQPKPCGVNSRVFQDRDPGHPSERKHEGQETGGNGRGFNGHSGNVLADGTTYLMANARTVWTIATRGYKGAHFATFPEELARRCILAGTSDRGCCPACGKPWKRIVIKTFIPQQDVSDERVAYRRETAGVPGNGWKGTPRGSNDIQTNGWRPGCTCDAGAPVPAVVLDPFCGSGTAVAVALGLGRRGLGCDLNPAYVRMGRERAPLLM